LLLFKCTEPLLIFSFILNFMTYWFFFLQQLILRDRLMCWRGVKTFPTVPPLTESSECLHKLLLVSLYFWSSLWFFVLQNALKLILRKWPSWTQKCVLGSGILIFCFVANTSKCGTALICMSTPRVIGRNQVVQLILEEAPVSLNKIWDESNDDRKVIQQRDSKQAI